MRRFNFLYLAGLLIAIAVSGGAAYALHSFQIRRHASALLARPRPRVT